MTPRTMGFGRDIQVIVQLSDAPLAQANGKNAKQEGGRINASQQRDYLVQLGRNKTHSWHNYAVLAGATFGGSAKRSTLWPSRFALRACLKLPLYRACARCASFTITDGIYRKLCLTSERAPSRMPASLAPVFGSRCWTAGSITPTSSSEALGPSMPTELHSEIP